MKSILGGLLFDEKPKVPDFYPIDPQSEQRTAISGNLAALPDLQELASKVNAFTSDELLKQLNKLYPGYSDLVQRQLGKTKELLSGEIPADVLRQLRQQSAEMATTTGTSGSSFATNQVLRNLGLTSLNLVNEGMNAASRWIAQANARSPIMDFTSMFITPSQQIATSQWNRSNQWNQQWLKNQIDAMPEGWEQAVQGLLDWVATTGSQVVGAYAGGAVGGGVGGMMGGMGGGGGGGGSYASQFSGMGANMGGGYGRQVGQFSPAMEEQGWNMLQGAQY